MKKIISIIALMFILTGVFATSPKGIVKDMLTIAAQCLNVQYDDLQVQIDTVEEKDDYLYGSPAHFTLIRTSVLGEEFRWYEIIESDSGWRLVMSHNYKDLLKNYNENGFMRGQYTVDYELLDNATVKCFMYKE